MFRLTNFKFHTVVKISKCKSVGLLAVSSIARNTQLHEGWSNRSVMRSATPEEHHLTQ